MTFDDLLDDYEEHISKYFKSDERAIAIVMNAANVERGSFEMNPQDLVHNLNWFMLNCRVIRRINGMFEYRPAWPAESRYMRQVVRRLLWYENRRLMMEFL